MKRILAPSPRIPTRHFVSARAGLSLTLDERALAALGAIVARTGETKTEALVRLLQGRPRSSKMARSVLVVEHCGLFGTLPAGRSIDVRARRWTTDVRRAYCAAYSVEHRAVRQRGGPLDVAREQGQEAGARGVLRVVGGRS